MTSLLANSRQVVLARSAPGPFDLAVILGSGLGGATGDAKLEAVIPYAELPGFPTEQIAGHRGQLVIGSLQGRRVLFFQGRFHLYQGLNARQVCAPVELAHQLGCRRILLTNASGGIRDDLEPGDLMQIDDHLNFMADNPLRGVREQPFVNLGRLYHQESFARLADAADRAGWTLHRGVLCGVTGPSYETPAEIRALRILGADAVSMSTIPEAIMAGYLGMTVCGLSLIANRAAGLSPAPLSHAEVLATADAAVPRLVTLLKLLVAEAPASAPAVPFSPGSE